MQGRRKNSRGVGGSRRVTAAQAQKLDKNNSHSYGLPVSHRRDLLSSDHDIDSDGTALDADALMCEHR